MNELEIRKLQAPIDPLFQGMTFPAYRRLLSLQRTSRHPEQGDSQQIDPVAWGAWFEGNPVGMLLAENPVVEPSEGTPISVKELIPNRVSQVLSVFVLDRFRGKGIGRALLEQAIRSSASFGMSALKAVYTTGRPSIDALEKIFARQGWSEPRPRTLSVRITLEAAFASSLLDPERITKIGRRLEIFPWSEVTEEDMERLRRSNQEKPWIAPLLAPWRFTNHSFDSSSVGARYRGEIVGWVINHRVSIDTIRLTCSFMRGDLSRRGRILPLYDAVLRQFEGTPCRNCTFITPYSYREMIDFIQRRLSPIAASVQETRETEILIDTKIFGSNDNSIE